MISIIEMCLSFSIPLTFCKSFSPFHVTDYLHIGCWLPLNGHSLIHTTCIPHEAFILLLFSLCATLPSPVSPRLDPKSSEACGITTVGYRDTSSIVLLTEYCLGYSWPLVLSYKFLVDFSMSLMNVIGIMMGIALNM
jgi:hypothetical protein